MQIEDWFKTHALTPSYTENAECHYDHADYKIATPWMYCYSIV